MGGFIPFRSARSGRCRSVPVLPREDHKAHNAFQILAERLVTQELAVLRFDYDGMGDYAGSNLDSGRVGAWLRSTADAIGLVRRFGVHRVSLVGMRIGATIAAHAAANDGDIDQLVLWDPCLSGRAFLREQQMLSVLKLATPTKRPDRLDRKTRAYCMALTLFGIFEGFSLIRSADRPPGACWF